MQARAYRQAFVAVALTWGCGAPFEAADVGDGGAANPVSVSGSSGTKPAQAPVAGPCRVARSGDEPLFDREVCIESATFDMGSNAPNLGEMFADHTPAHSVTLSGFALDVYEVSVARYRSCVNAGACPALTGASSKGCTYTADVQSNEGLPVTCASWPEAQSFCEFDGQRRLPTEAEWEYAARGSEGRSYPWGDTFSCIKAFIGGYAAGPCPANAGSLPHRVGSNPGGESPSGAFDLVGNAAEWVSDWAGSYAADAVKDPQGPPMGAGRILRGGSWGSALALGLGYARSTSPPEARGPWGFRCARNP